MLCEKGVLIPRPETEAWASMLADLALSSRDHIHIVDEGKDGEDVRILDLCSGTGCIGLSLYARGMALRRRGASEGKGKGKGMGKGEGAVARSNPPLRVFGFDVEPRAVRLGRKNLRHNFSRRHLSPPGHIDIIIIIEEEAVKQAVTFEQADIFTDEWMASLEHNNNNDNPSSKYEDEDEDEHKAPSRRRRRRRIDVLVSNPPYVSQRGFETDTGRNVRNYEPKLALVPSPSPSPSPACAPEDIFYARLLEIADTLRPRIAAFEVGDMAQAIRVVEMAIARRCRHLHPDSSSSSQREDGEDGDAARWDVLEIWRDWPDCLPSDAEEDGILVCGRKVPVRGSGHGRVVFLSEGPILRNRFTNRGFRRAFYTE
ncbi:hypothetical protein CHU98_g9530 [Xylaria longipes]|nr:hypothetical protein CHU98_g9530 [Xylaria longipes]